MKVCLSLTILLVIGLPAFCQDQQIGARAKAMGGSYTAFEDDPVSIWLNPAGTSTQPNSVAICYQTYVTYPLQEKPVTNSNQVINSANAQATFVDPVILPAFIGLVFQIGDASLPMALGICYASPYHLNYTFTRVMSTGRSFPTSRTARTAPPASAGARGSSWVSTTTGPTSK